MSQHQTSITFKRPVDGLRTSSCGRFVVEFAAARPPAARWTLTDISVGREVFAGELMRDCRVAAIEIINAPQGLHPAAVGAGLDASWSVGEAKTTGERHASGDLVAWKTRHGVVNLEPQPIREERRRAAEQRALEAYHAEVATIELELEVTDEEPGEVAAHEVVSATRRDAVRTAVVFERTGEERGASHDVPASVPPVPHPWLDFVVRVYEGNTLHVVERRVYIRDGDTEEDIWRRCKHVIKGVGGDGKEHKYQGQSDAQGEAQGPLRSSSQRTDQSCDRRPGRSDPDGRRRGEPALHEDRRGQPQRQADRRAEGQGQARRRRSWSEAPSGPAQDHRAPRGRMTGAELMMLSDYDSSRGATW